jgi:hypothetical protein
MRRRCQPSSIWGLHQEARPAGPRPCPADRREQGTVGGLKPGTGDLTTQNSELMAQHQDLQLLGGVAMGEQGEQLDGAAQRQVGESWSTWSGLRNRMKEPSQHRPPRRPNPQATDHIRVSAPYGLPAVAPGRESGAACVRCSARRSLPAPSRDVADPRSASGPAAHAGLSPPIAQPPRSRVMPSRASARSGCPRKRRCHRSCR